MEHYKYSSDVLVDPEREISFQHHRRSVPFSVELITNQGTGAAAALGPRRSTWLHVSHTLTCLVRLYLMMATFLSEQEAQRRRPQCRQWCFLRVIPNLAPHSSQQSPSPHLGSALRES